MRRFTLPSLLCLVAIAGPALGGEPASDEAAGDGTGSATVPVATRWSAIGEPSDAGYRVSLARGGVDVGLDFQRRLAAVRVVDARVDSAAPPVADAAGAVVRSAQRQRPGADEQPGRSGRSAQARRRPP